MNISFLSLNENFKVKSNLPKNNIEKLTNVLAIAKNILKFIYLIIF